MKATIVDDIEKGAPGALEPVVQHDSTELAGFAMRCPGCGSLSWLSVRADDPPPSWTLTGYPESITLSPSVFHRKERGGCGWHGFLTAGEWRPC